MNNKQARDWHQMLDRLAKGETLSPQNVESLRELLPELPKQKTLEEIAWDIDFAWAETSGNDWKDEMFGNLETWLSEQHTQLRAHLEGVKSEAHPEFLEAEADYQKAPEGTIVACEDSSPWHKFGPEWLSVDFCGAKDDKGMSRARRRVLRWGK